MPKWQFLIVKHFGGPLQRQQTCARIKQQVEQQGLSDILPLVNTSVAGKKNTTWESPLTPIPYPRDVTPLILPDMFWWTRE